jgi:DNA-binding transcriptional LysR family regulator
MQSRLALRDLRCFTVVAARSSFSRAAVELGLSQPAVSQAIGRLERQLGPRLFDRTSREVHLTPAGKALLPYAEAVLEAAADLGAESARLATPLRPIMRLAYPPLIGGLAARVVRRLSRASPPVEIELVPAGWSVATGDLSRGAVPAAILAAPFPAGFTATARFQLTIGHLAVPAGDRLAARSAIRPAQLAHRSVLVPRHRPPGGMWARLCALLPGSCRPRTVGEDIDDYSAPLDLVAAGSGLLPVPGLVADTIRRPDVQFAPLDAGDLRITYGLAFDTARASAELMALVQAVQGLLRAR